MGGFNPDPPPHFEHWRDSSFIKKLPDMDIIQDTEQWSKKEIRYFTQRCKFTQVWDVSMDLRISAFFLARSIFSET